MADAAAQLPPGSFDSRVPTVIVAIVVCLSVATTAVGLRIYTRKIIINQMGWDDYFAIFALLLAYGLGITQGCMTMYGFGRHIWILQPTDIVLYLRSFYVSLVMYCAGLFAVKMTFLWQYYRVMAVQKIRKVFVAAMFIVGGWSLSQVFIAVFFCVPTAAFWDQTVSGTCVPSYPQFYINAAGNIITDVAVFLLPIPILGKLKLARKQKLMLIGVFSLGFLTVAISVVRIKYLHPGPDLTWENVEASGWSIGELSCGITCACLPTLRPFLSRYAPAFLTSRGNSSAKRSSRGYRKHSWGWTGTGDSRSPRDLENGTAVHSGGAGGVLQQGGRGGGKDDDSDGTEHHHRAAGGVSLQTLGRRGSSTEELSEDVVGLVPAREALSRAGRGTEEDAQSSVDGDTGARLGLRTTVRTEVNSKKDSGWPEPEPDRGIQVRKDVWQYKKERNSKG